MLHLHSIINRRGKKVLILVLFFLRKVKISSVLLCPSLIFVTGDIVEVQKKVTSFFWIVQIHQQKHFGIKEILLSGSCYIQRGQILGGLGCDIQILLRSCQIVKLLLLPELGHKWLSHVRFGVVLCRSLWSFFAVKTSLYVFEKLTYTMKKYYEMFLKDQLTKSISDSIKHGVLQFKHC